MQPFEGAVMFYDLAQRDNRQMSMFETGTPMTESLMATLDEINRRYGRLTLRYGAMGLHKVDWHMRQERRSPPYTGDWSELAIVKC